MLLLRPSDLHVCRKSFVPPEIGDLAAFPPPPPFIPPSYSSSSSCWLAGWSMGRSRCCGAAGRRLPVPLPDLGRCLTASARSGGPAWGETEREGERGQRSPRGIFTSSLALLLGEPADGWGRRGLAWVHGALQGMGGQSGGGAQASHNRHKKLPVVDVSDRQCRQNFLTPPPGRHPAGGRGRE